MVNQDIASSLSYVTLLPNLARTSTANGSSVDLKAAYQGGPAAILLTNNTTSGTTPTLDVKVQDSADNSTFADVSGYAFSQVTAALTNPSALNIDTKNLRRYVRLVVTIGGTSPSFLCGAILVIPPQVT